MLGGLASKVGFANSRAFDIDADLPDLSGKVAVVTGGNDGIGFITVRALWRKGCKVYLACRSEQKARDAIARLTKEHPGSDHTLVFLPFDLTQLASAKKAGETLEQNESRLDIVVCNAGVMAWPYELVNGVEVQFWNHLGHFALVQAVLPLLKKTAQAPGATSVRVVSVSSVAHQMSPKPDYSSLESVNRQMTSTWQRYGQSKLANIHFAVALQNRLEGENIRVNTLHPGNINTSLMRGPVASYGFFGKVIKATTSRFLMTPDDGAKTQIYLAASREVDEKDYRGKYFIPIATPATPTAYAQDKELADQLWRLSEDLVKQLST
ncbi:hypothetical protein JCM3775_001394 [Rhodotorula graminis]|uniref:NAD(P)-binding protein n=1 Tax=Rhodotorula graminis (strain WP1) TaxID=578459 RepID=A0A194S6Y0_RHOGW|nr:uncharacterized protein RHOBADRAFT_42682 [Rhodotorula graminis WP1]KPV76352.1 hypothetical protein RHOBADRAFT_42682 [Rhodotorula graminis WP1]